MRLLIALLLLSIGILGPSMAKDRTELHLFRYGRTYSEDLRAAFLDFRDLMLEKLPRLAAELDPEVSIPAVAQLALRAIEGEGECLESAGDRLASLEARRRYWLETGALALLTGHMQQLDGTPHVHTVFYWGPLRGPYPKEMIDLKLPVTGDSFDTTEDSHSVATLYALAHYLGADCSASAAAFYLLSEAQKRANAVAADAPELLGDLETLVTRAIEALRNRCGD
jgi:hypothetical protein